MTREVRFSTSNLSYSSPNEDCFLDPSDPIHALQGQGVLGTLTPASVTAAYDAHKRQQISDQHFQLRDEAKRLGIRPGTPAWFALNQSR
jgi:hypothetical protein